MIRIITVFLTIIIANIAYAETDDLVVNLEQRINELTNQLEQLTHKNDLLLKKLDSLAEDIEYRIKMLEKQNPNQTQQVKKTKVTDPKQIKEAFDKALGLLKAQRPLEAEQALDSFAKTYPNSEYTGNAYYWLGESFMSRKKYDKAAINYILSFNKFPKNNKANLSMLKLFSALNALGKKKEACAVLTKLKLKTNSLSPTLKTMLQKEVNKAKCNNVS